MIKILLPQMKVSYICIYLYLLYPHNQVFFPQGFLITGMMP